MKNRTNARGVTLVEVMISLVILLIVFMGLIQASLLSIDQNLRSLTRDEAGRVAAQYMALTKDTNFNDPTLSDTNLVCANPVVPATCPRDATNTPFCLFPGQDKNNLPLATPTVNIRNQVLNFTVARSVGDLDTANKRVGVCVYWTYRGDFQPAYIAYSVMRAQ